MIYRLLNLRLLTFFIIWRDYIWIAYICQPPHLGSYTAVDSISTNDELTIVDSSIISNYAASIIKELYLCDPLFDKNIGLCWIFIIQYFQYLLTIYGNNGISKPILTFKSAIPKMLFS